MTFTSAAIQKIIVTQTNKDGGKEKMLRINHAI
jgi:hypothetical protein